MPVFILGLLLLALPTLASTIDLRNDREGKSFYSGRSHEKAKNKAIDKLGENIILNSYQDTLREVEKSSLCSFTVNELLLNKLKQENSRFKEFEGAIYYLREQNEIDDVVVKILLDAYEVSTTKVYNTIDENSFLPPHDKVKPLLSLIGAFKEKFLQSSGCLDEAYKRFYADAQKVEKNISKRHLESLYALALEEDLIDRELYTKLEQARRNDLHTRNLTLKSYHQKMTSLRLQFPLRDQDEKSEFVTGKTDKLKMSRRQFLLEHYSDIQIALMGDVIKKLRTRLDSPKAEILIYDRNQGIETITLEPMERFRLAIKLLRKEMSYLSLNTFFNGTSPGYLDLMTAAYESGIIPASELDEIAGLEDMWNPKKTFWQKAKVWVTTLGTVATVIIPPPYGFLPALAIVVIEYTTGADKDPDAYDPTSLF